jgi:hypothetical protein
MAYKKKTNIKKDYGVDVETSAAKEIETKKKRPETVKVKFTCDTWQDKVHYRRNHVYDITERQFWDLQKCCRRL